jgi:hypothetical protein
MMIVHAEVRMRIRLSLLVLSGLIAGAVVAPPARTIPPVGGGDCTRILCNDCKHQTHGNYLTCIWVEYEGGCFCDIYGPNSGVQTCEIIGNCCRL